MKSRVVLACCLLTIPSTLLCRELIGTVYSDHSGPSGSGVGEVQVATKIGLVRIDYQKPIKQDFSNVRCWEVGAIWTVWTEGGSLGSEDLVRAHCDGRVDVPVHSAWIAARNYIKTVAQDAGYELGFQPGRRSPIIVKMDGVEVDISGYLNFGASGMCLEMKGRVNAKTIIIESSADCYFGPDYYLDFAVEQVAPAAWRVTSVKAVGPTR